MNLDCPILKQFNTIRFCVGGLLDEVFNVNVSLLVRYDNEITFSFRRIGGEGVQDMVHGYMHDA